MDHSIFNVCILSNNGGLGIKGELLSRYLMFYGSVCNNTKTYYTKLCAELCELSNTTAASNRRLSMAQLNIDRLCFQDSCCIYNEIDGHSFVSTCS